jgi:putative ABC transport system substrate-binding protein
MRRFHAFVTALLILLASAVAAQTQTKLARIGMLCPVRCTGPGYDAFDGERRKLGWIEGRNLTTERRALEGHYERVREIAADLVRSRPDVIVGPGATVARALKEATSEIPIAFSFVARPVELGLVQSLAQPGGNATGVTALTAGAFLAKQFEILREFLPQAQRIALLANPANEDHRLTLTREIPMAAQLGLQIEVIEVRAPEEIPAAMAKLKALNVEGVLVLGDVVLNNAPNRVPDHLGQQAIPVMYSNRDAVLAGGLMAYIPDMLAISRRHAHYVDRILRGASPAEIPVEQPTEYDLIVNLKTARALGLTVPPSLLARADEVIE